MHNTHSKNTVRYYLLLVIALAFLFFSNDFGLIDVQKTAIVMAVGIDREDDAFILTSQIAIPQPSKQDKSTQSVQIVSRGKTVSDAFEEINAKTGWYPKLVFCKLIILGENAAKQNVFDALDYFLRDEYLSDDCLVATCDGLAKDLLNVTALVDPSGATAMQKILSPHAEKVGATLPATLREFAIGYFSDSRSAYMPILKTQPQQEEIGNENANSTPPSPQNSNSPTKKEEKEGQSQNKNQEKQGSQEKQVGQGKSNQEENKNDKPVFSAGETALFVDGKWVERLTREESFAVGAVTSALRLAKYSVPSADNTCTLIIKQNHPKTRLTLEKSDHLSFKISVVLTAGISDYSKAQDLQNISDVGDVPNGVFTAAEKKLSAEITRAFEKCRLCGCDLFGIQERLYKYEKQDADRLADSALTLAIPNVEVRFRNVR